MKNTKKIKVAQLVENYNSLSSSEGKEDLIKSLVIREYMPVLEKKLVIQTMFDKSLVNDNGNVYVDMFINKINVTFGILAMYTRIDFNKSDDPENSLFDDYDLLMENDLLNKLFNYIPESELNQILTINDQVHETFYNKYKSTEAFVNSVIDRVSTVAGIFLESATDKLNELMQNEDVIKEMLKGLK